MMSQNTMNSQELISALADGELDARDAARALDILERSPQARAFWHETHLVGDALRARELTQGAAGDAEFVARLGQRLQRETAAPRVLSGAVRPATRGVRRPEAANESAWRWKMVAGFTFFAVFTGILWRVVADGPGGQTGATLAAHQAPAVSTAGGPAPAMIRDPRLDQLLAAHQQFGGASALLKPAGFLRNATYERPLP